MINFGGRERFSGCVNKYQAVENDAIVTANPRETLTQPRRHQRLAQDAYSGDRDQEFRLIVIADSEGS